MFSTVFTHSGVNVSYRRAQGTYLIVKHNMLTEILPPLHPHPPTPRQRITGQIITIEYRNYVQSLIKMRGFYSSIPLFPNFSFCILSSHVHPWERQSACTGRDIIWFCETKYESIQQRCWHITQTATDLGFA